MSFPEPLLNLSANISTVAYGFVGIAALFIAIKSAQPSKLDAIPTVGSSSWIGSWWYAFKFFGNARDIIQEGYKKYKSKPFKVSAVDGWMVIVGSREHVDELQKAPDDTLSLPAVAWKRFQGEYLLGSEILHNPYHMPILRSQLTRNMGDLYPVLRDEITTALDDILDLEGNEWKSIPALDSMRKVVCRTSNRVFVGLPLCRNSDWVALTIQYSIDIMFARSIISLFPKLLRPIAVRLFTNVGRSKQLGRKLLGPIIEERRRFLNDSGNQWNDKPNDLLSWLMENAEGPELTTKYLTNRMLTISLVAIHTSSNSFTHALFYLVMNPQYIQPLREEVEGIVKKDGWTKHSLGKMRKLDSFLKECLRLESISYANMQRMALKDFTFSDGTFIPKGTMVFVASQSIHDDEAFYENADVFEPFRFAQEESKSGDYAKPNYLAFGLGRNSCPGRVFAVTEVKTMVAHIVVTYDIKLDDKMPRPQSWGLGLSNVPDSKAKIMFRRRVD